MLNVKHAPNKLRQHMFTFKFTSDNNCALRTIGRYFLLLALHQVIFISTAHVIFWKRFQIVTSYILMWKRLYSILEFKISAEHVWIDLSPIFTTQEFPFCVFVVVYLNPPTMNALKCRTMGYIYLVQTNT